MKPDQALQIIQTVLDASVKAGILPNLAAADAAAQAWAILKNIVNGSENK